ncbi:MAG: hypothetical protein WC996_07660 [Peptostreptococcales bacterium]
MNYQNIGDEDMKLSEEFQRLYPDIYSVIYPEIEKQCNTLEETKGPDYIPSKDELEQMTNAIYDQVNIQLSRNMKQDVVARRYGRRGLRDIISIILIGELLRRRRRPYYPPRQRRRRRRLI